MEIEYMYGYYLCLCVQTMLIWDKLKLKFVSILLCCPPTAIPESAKAREQYICIKTKQLLMIFCNHND